MKRIADLFWNKEFVAFVIIGIINTCNGVILSYLYSSVMNANVAFLFGYITGLGVSYVLNSYYTFKERYTFMKFLKFSISYIPNFIIQNLVVYVIYNLLEMHKLIAFGLAAIIGVPITFLCMKLYAFRDKGWSRVKEVKQ